MPPFLVLAICFVAMTTLAGQSLGRPQDNFVLPSKYEHLPFILTNAMNDFGYNLFDLLSHDQNGNMVFSPFSIHTSLSMVYLGTPPKSVTNTELSNLLGLRSEDLEVFLTNYVRLLNHYKQIINQNAQLNFANKLFTDKRFTIKQDFLDGITTFYKSSLDQIDFADKPRAAGYINDFVKNQTNGLIDQVITEDAITSLTRLIVINAIYFKANWLFQFNKSQTRPMKFRVNKNTEITVPHGMYMRENVRMATIPKLEADVLELPYVDDNFRMLIIVPTKGHDIKEVGKNLLHLNLIEIDEILDAESINSDVEVFLPRFKIEFEISELVETLKLLGVNTLFDESLANLSDISDEPLYVSKAIHKATIEVNEEGSEASAVTGIIVDTRSGSPKNNRQFRADQPFIFYIFDKNFEVPLFMGRIVDPTGKNVLDSSNEGGLAERTGVNFASGCSEIGYDVTNSNRDSVSLPCLGEDTFHVRKQQEDQAKIQKRLAQVSIEQGIFH